MSSPPPHEVLRADSAPLSSVSTRLSHLVNRLQPTQEAIVLLLAVLIGGAAGMGVVTFRYLIQFIHQLTLETLMGFVAPWGAWTLALVPTMGGLIVGLMRWWLQDFGPGLSSLISTAQGLRELSPFKPVSKMVAASISIGTGASLGPEGPSVEIGANFGILLGQVLQMSQERQRLLLGAGAAAGLAAGFNAPIAGVFFALEVVLGTSFATSAVSVVLLAAVVASLIAQIGLGAQPAFVLPSYEVRSPWELPLYMGLGLGACLISIAYTQSIKWVQQGFKGKIPSLIWLSRIPRPLQPILGGACVGIVALQWPQIMGVGYETIEAILRDVEFSLPLLLILTLVKLVITAISLGSGLVGGIFAPAMFLGAASGAAYGKAIAGLLSSTPIHIAAAPAYAMVGMAAVLAGSARAPLTAILLLFELTRDYRIVLPLMAAVGLSAWLVDRWQTPAIPADSDAQQQQEASPEKVQKLTVLQHVLVGDAMQLQPLRLDDQLSVLDAGRLLIHHQVRSALVMDQTEQLIGIVTLQDINRAIARAETGNRSQILNQAVSNICTTELLYAYRDEPVADASARMAARDLHQLPVVERDRPQQVIGLLEREAISLAYSLASTQSALELLVVEVPSADPQQSAAVPDCPVA